MLRRRRSPRLRMPSTTSNLTTFPGRPYEDDLREVVGNSLVVATIAEGRAVIMLMEAKPDGSLEGKYWRRTDAGTKGTEVWKKK